MIEIKGEYNTAKIFTDNVESEAINQIRELCNQEFVKGNKIRIMPDTHAGAGCTIGTTMTIKDKIAPNLVGVDIGCGMLVCKLNITKNDVDFEKLDKVIRKHIPSGFSIRKEPYLGNLKILSKIIAAVDIRRALLSIGTLGGGNHFIELNEDRQGNIYLVIHTGSRNLGKQIAEYHQNIAIKNLFDVSSKRKEIVDKLKSEGKEKEISEALKKIEPPKINKNLAYLEGKDFDNYINDMKIAQQFASLNRVSIANIILNEMNWYINYWFETIHNYIDIENLVLRKGAISAEKGEKVIIPINMRDGSIIALGKGNEDWNCSGPHGAGRLMSRRKAKESIKLEDYEESMKNVWTTSVNERTVDESPFAYKPIEDIIENIKDSLDVIDIIKPIYNFKAN